MLTVLKDQIDRERMYRPLQFHECGRLFVGT